MSRSPQLHLPLFGRRRRIGNFFRDLKDARFPRPASRGAQRESQVRRFNGEGENGKVCEGADISSVYYRLSAEQGRVFRKVCEFILSLSGVFLGIQFAVGGWPPAAVDDQFLPMQMIASPVLWGVSFILLGVSRLAVLIVNGWWKHTHLVRRWLSLTYLFIIWLPIGACYWTSILSGAASLASETNVSAVFIVTVVAAEYLVFYAHTSFVYVGKAIARDERGTGDK